MVRLLLVPALLGAAALLPAQPYGTKPKPKPQDYPAGAAIGDLALGAEYLVHTLPAGRRTFVIRDHLVVEVAVYPPKSQAPVVSSGLFTLRINGKKDPVYAQTSGMVAAGLKYSDWDMPRGVEAGVGPVIIGRPRTTPRFPGDNRSDESRTPAPPRVPVDTAPGVDRPEPQSAADAVNETAFPDGPASGPVSGYLFFPFKGKPKSIKLLELVFSYQDQQATIRFF